MKTIINITILLALTIITLALIQKTTHYQPLTYIENKTTNLEQKWQNQYTTHSPPSSEQPYSSSSTQPSAPSSSP